LYTCAASKAHSCEGEEIKLQVITPTTNFVEVGKYFSMINYVAEGIRLQKTSYVEDEKPSPMTN
jgi:hypothetical protein